MSKERVILYATESCPHCINFKPEWEKLTKLLEKEGISFRKVNAELEQIPNDVYGFPTLRIDGKDYKGPRIAESILNHTKTGGKDDKQPGDKYSQCGGGSGGFTPRKFNKKNVSSKNDANDDEYYKIKYFKYKAKYMKLRSLIEN